MKDDLTKRCCIPGCDRPVSDKSVSGQLCAEHVKAAKRQSKRLAKEYQELMTYDEKTGMLWGYTDA